MIRLRDGTKIARRRTSTEGRVKHILLKFSVSGVGGRTVTSAKLRLYAVDPSPLGGRFYRVAGSSWSESTVI